jgi:hypothetical protein
MCAIMTALQAHPISRLDLTHEAMANREQRRYQKLATLLKRESNYGAYKVAVQLDNQKGCIPWHGTLI